MLGHDKCFKFHIYQVEDLVTCLQTGLSLLNLSPNATTTVCKTQIFKADTVQRNEPVVKSISIKEAATDWQLGPKQTCLWR